MLVQRSTNNYKLSLDNGAYVLTRHEDKKTITLDGDDMLNFENNYGAGTVTDQMLDWICCTTFATH